jgi:hypothetical protein
MKKYKSKKIIVTIIAFLATLLITAGALIGYKLLLNKKNQNIIINSDNNKSSSKSNTEQATKGEDTKPKSNSSQVSQNLAKPVLIKSSGNNGPVPSGVLVNFVCQSFEAISCDVELRNSAGTTISLGYKDLKNNQTDQYFADWYWSSLVGDWIVSAKAKNQQGLVSESDPQSLSVK